MFSAIITRCSVISAQVHKSDYLCNDVRKLWVLFISEYFDEEKMSVINHEVKNDEIEKKRKYFVN